MTTGAFALPNDLLSLMLTLLISAVAVFAPPVPCCVGVGAWAPATAPFAFEEDLNESGSSTMSPTTERIAVAVTMPKKKDVFGGML